MKTKKTSILDSLWFNALMSLLSLAILGNDVISNIISTDYFHQWVKILLWIIISFHFIRATILKRKALRE